MENKVLIQKDIKLEGNIDDTIRKLASLPIKYPLYENFTLERSDNGYNVTGNMEYTNTKDDIICHKELLKKFQTIV